MICCTNEWIEPDREVSHEYAMNRIYNISNLLRSLSPVSKNKFYYIEPSDKLIKLVHELVFPILFRK